MKAFVSISIIGFVVWFAYRLVVHPHPYNTEQVCFNNEGRIVFYASGFKPSETPLVHINGKKHKNIKTGATVTGACKWSWGANEPKGYEYWRLK